jgi:hypothetical protein
MVLKHPGSRNGSPPQKDVTNHVLCFFAQGDNLCSAKRVPPRLKIIPASQGTRKFGGRPGGVLKLRIRVRSSKEERGLSNIETLNNSLYHPWNIQV